MAESDIYKTIIGLSKGEIFKDRNSKFYGFAFHVKDEEEVKQHQENLKKEHYAARHWCYAFQIGIEDIHHRANDDGEPSNSAGMPIYGQIQSFEVTNILIVVVRYYGGVKLGVGGLINAYRTAAKWALDAATIVEKTIDNYYQLKFEYKNMSKVMRLLNDYDVEITNRILELDCELHIAVRKSISEKLFQKFEDFFGVEIRQL